jgi:putative endonuclease
MRVSTAATRRHAGPSRSSAEHFLNITDAIAVERQIKGWSRAKKEALVRGDYDAIQTLAKRRG